MIAALSGKFRGPPVTDNSLIVDALHTLHGARGLPAKDAVAALTDFLNSISAATHDRFSHAAMRALKQLINKLQTAGAASDDDWQSAIETMQTLANDNS
jgi:hypothetical protein